MAPTVRRREIEEPRTSALPIHHTPAPRPTPTGPGEGDAARTRGPGGSGPVDAPIETRRAAWAERADGQAQRAEHARPEVRVGDRPTTGGTYRGVGVGGGPSRGTATGELGDAAARYRDRDLIGATGVRRQGGLQSITADAARGDLTSTDALLTRSLEQTGAGDQVRFRIGRETLTAGQLRYELQQNPERFRDFLHANGVSVAELNELLDDVNTSNPAAGTTFDLRPGSELARAYSIGGPDGAAVDYHLDASRTRTAAGGHAGIEDRVDVSAERVEGPGFWQQIADALSEAVAAIARVFGSSWNPDTATFNGRVDDAHFRQAGADIANGPRGFAVQALLATPGGEDRLRHALLAQKPESATDAQWARAVDGMIQGARTRIGERSAAGELPRDMSTREAEQALVYMRSQNFSADAEADVRLALSQPAAVRAHALPLLVSLPEAERNNMLGVLRAPTGTPGDTATDADWRAWTVANTYASGNDAQRVALFETLRQDGFQNGPNTYLAEEAATAVGRADQVPEAVRQRYLDAIPRLGVHRAHLAGDNQRGLATQLSDRPERAATLMTDFEASSSSTAAMERTLGAGAFRLRLTDPGAGQISGSTAQRRVVDTFDAHNVRLRYQPADAADAVIVSARGQGAGEVSLARYFSDSTYRSQTLARLGMNRAQFEGMLTNVSGSLRDESVAGNRAALQQRISTLQGQIADPTTSAPDRAEAERELRQARLELATLRAPTNIEIDVSPGSRVDRLFDLSGTGGASAAQQLTEERLLAGDNADFTVSLRGRGRQTHEIAQHDLVELIRNPPAGQTAQEAFEARYPGLDYAETTAAFAQLTELYWNGTIESPDDGSSARIDLTQRSGNPAFDRIRAQLGDRTSGNVSPGSTLSTTVGAHSTAERTDTSLLTTDARIGAAAGNNWFQYGVFNLSTGYYSAHAVQDRARASYIAAGSTTDPAHAMAAVLGLDGFARSDTVGGVSHRQLGTAHGQLDDFMVDPRTGTRAEARDFQLISFSGSGSSTDRTAFARSAARTRDTFTRYGGIPEAQTEIHANPTPERMYRAIQAEILNDPRPADQRTDASGAERRRTVVVSFAGHTVSHRTTNSPMGMMLTAPDGTRALFTTAQIAELDRQAREQGVNLVWITDACRAGSFVDATAASDRTEAAAAGRLPAEVSALTGLHESVQLNHMILHVVNQRGAQPSPMPNRSTLARMGAEALQGGPGSPAMLRLTALRDRVAATPGMSDDNKFLMQRYVDSIEGIMTNRSALAGTAGLDPSILSHGLVTGSTTWRPGRVFQTHTIGPLGDAITGELRNRTPTPVVTPRDEP